MSLTVFFGVLLVSLVVMAISIWFIRQQLKANKQREERIKAGEARYQEERQKAIDSIQVLLKVAGTDEVSWVETCIRVKHLLDRLSMDLSSHDAISVIYDITAKTEHIPTHDQWRTLPKQAKRNFQKEMETYEKDYADALQQAKASLLAYDFSE
ncbi:DUF2489 domain-containing protein [Marinomonas sp. THO17]|uniref:DUF2489 domain-containing protein n=1 Tax=Marinomonas sp. THO17 TaxID=3149048 RepID=UPI00336BD454